MASKNEASAGRNLEIPRVVTEAWEQSVDDDDTFKDDELLIDNLTPLQMSELRKAFEIFDQEGDGYINPRKLGRVLKYLGRNPTEAEVQDLIESVDEDGNGQIEFEEFASMMSKKIQEQTREEEIKEAFRVFDRNENGVISLDEISYVFTCLGQNFSREELTDMLNAADVDGDRQVTYKDFLEVFKDDS